MMWEVFCLVNFTGLISRQLGQIQYLKRRLPFIRVILHDNLTDARNNVPQINLIDWYVSKYCRYFFKAWIIQKLLITELNKNRSNYIACGKQ